MFVQWITLHCTGDSKMKGSGRCVETNVGKRKHGNTMKTNLTTHRFHSTYEQYTCCLLWKVDVMFSLHDDNRCHWPLANSMDRVLLETQGVSHLVKNSCRLWNLNVHYRIHKNLLQAPIQCTPSYCISPILVLYHLILSPPSWALHALPSRRPWFDNANNIWWGLQIMKYVLMQFSPASCHFIPLRSKYFF
jgi:hypothetical protein